MKRQRNYSKKRNLRKPLIIVLCVLAVAGIVVTALELTNKIDLFNKEQKQLPTNNQNTKGEPVQTPTNNGTSKQNEGQPNTPTETKGQSDTPVTSETNLIQPTGTFVSNHFISLSGNPAVQSSCETTPKANCQISFTKDGVTKTLETKATDFGGAAYWTWKPKDIGLTPGKWKVQAKATLGSQTKTAEDSLALEVAE